MNVLDIVGICFSLIHALVPLIDDCSVRMDGAEEDDAEANHEGDDGHFEVHLIGASGKKYNGGGDKELLHKPIHFPVSGACQWTYIVCDERERETE